MTTALAFQATTFKAIDHQGQPWLMGTEISHALGYSRADRVAEIYKRNSAEFTSSMTCTRKLRVQDQQREVRIFSLRGAHLLAMFARTPVAADFRRWVLDILDKEVGAGEAATQGQPALPKEISLVLHFGADGSYRTRALEAGDCIVNPTRESSLFTLLSEFLPANMVQRAQAILAQRDPRSAQVSLPAGTLQTMAATLLELAKGTPAPAKLCAPPAAQHQGKHWKDPVKVEALLRSMRFREDEMYDHALISPDALVQLHRAGKVGPRQWRKLKPLITN